MDIKDIQVGKMYRFEGPDFNGYRQTGTVLVDGVDNEFWPISGFGTLDNPEDEGTYGELLLDADEIIAEVTDGD